MEDTIDYFEENYLKRLAADETENNFSFKKLKTYGNCTPMATPEVSGIAGARYSRFSNLEAERWSANLDPQEAYSRCLPPR